MNIAIKKRLCPSLIGNRAITLILCVSIARAQDIASASSPPDSSNASPQPPAININNLFEGAPLPQRDLVVVNSIYDEKKLFVMTSTQGLEQMAARAGRMSMIPPSGATLYMKGYPVGEIALPFFVDKKILGAKHAYGSNTIVEAELKERIFIDDGLGYVEKRAQLEQTPGRYILEQDVIAEFHYLDVAFPNYGDFSQRLRDKRGFILKGEHADYRIGEFHDLLVDDDADVRTEWETPGGQELLRLRLYYQEGNNPLMYEQIFTQHDALTLLGQPYVLKSGPRYNKIMKLTWLEFLEH